MKTIVVFAAFLILSTSAFSIELLNGRQKKHLGSDLGWMIKSGRLKEQLLAAEKGYIVTTSEYYFIDGEIYDRELLVKGKVTDSHLFGYGTLAAGSVFFVTKNRFGEYIVENYACWPDQECNPNWSFIKSRLFSYID